MVEQKILNMKAVILHIPHSSIIIPEKEGYVINDNEIKNEIIKLTDWYTDDLFSSNNTINIIAPFSRIFCDVERFSDDSQEVMAQFGMGVLYTQTDDGNLMRNVSQELREHILNEYYWRHHNQLTNAVKSQLEQYNTATIIDCHSFPEIPINRSLDKTSVRPDFNIGTSPYHTPKRLIDASVAFFESKGHSLGIDYPYKDSIVPMEFYNKDNRVNSIMLEINRKLYLNGNSNEKSESYDYTKTIVQEFVEVISKHST